MELLELLRLAFEKKASDVHLSSGEKPKFRVDGELHDCDSFQRLGSKSLEKAMLEILTEDQKAQFLEELEIDFAYHVEGLARFRVNLFSQNRGIAAVFRVIPTKVLSLEQIQAPKVLESLCAQKQGLILVTGATGSGKSTTLAAMVDHINQTRHRHIITIEDPIEFVHTSNLSLINQRELGAHTHEFESALKSALREDPDVILVGEMRDLATIRLALAAAETGHLVLATLHTQSAAKTIDRIVGSFPATEKDQIRAMLAESVTAVIAQDLLPKKGGGRVAVYELMLATPAIRNLIREAKTPQIRSAIQTGRNAGMQTKEQGLEHLRAQNLID